MVVLQHGREPSLGNEWRSGAMHDLVVTLAFVAAAALAVAAIYVAATS
jgi:hypothetical protein